MSPYLRQKYKFSTKCQLLNFTADALQSFVGTAAQMNELVVSNGNGHSLHKLDIYQSPLILTELFQHNLINVSYLTACYLYQVMMTLHF